MQFRISPGGNTPSSSRSRPELPPSSVTVTITDNSARNCFSPRNRVDRPVPPPMQTILGFQDSVLRDNAFPSCLYLSLLLGGRNQLLERGIVLERLEVAVACG